MYDSILVPTDGSEGAEAAAGHARTLASAFDADVHVLSVVDDRVTDPELEGFDAEVWEHFDDRARRWVDALAGDLEDADVDCHVAVKRGVPHRRILGYAEEEGVDLVAMGTHGRSGLDRLLMGSVTERVLRKSDVPVVTVREDQAAEEYEDVLVPTDGSDTAMKAVDHGVAVAAAFDARVHALAVVDVGSLGAAYDAGSGVPEVIEGLQRRSQNAVEEVAAACDDHDVAVETHVNQGSPRAAILDYVEVEGIDLVTMGTHGRSGVGRLLLGSVTERVLRESAAPVMTVR